MRGETQDYWNYIISEARLEKDINHISIRTQRYKYIFNEFNQRIKTKNTPFFNHKEFAFKLTATEIWHRKMSKSLENYSVKSHKKTLGSKKQ